MFNNISLCSLVVMILSVAILVYAFYFIFLQKQNNENDINVIQRQIRGFALITVSNLVMIIGTIVCAGALLPALMKELQ
jgi:hypothetical protein